MLLFEMKKIWKKPLNKAAFIALAAIVAIASFLTIRDIRYTDENGDSHSGIAAIGRLKEDKKEWEGPVTEEVLRRVLEENQRVYKLIYAAETIQEEDAAFSQTEGFSDIRDIINYGFGAIGDYDYYRIDGVALDQVGTLYERRIANLRTYMDTEEHFTQPEREYLLNRYEEFQTPIEYEYFEGWRALVDSQYLPTLMLILALIAGILVSGIFSDEFIYKADTVFFSSRLGRGRGTGAKLWAGFLTATIVYWAAIFIYAAVILGIAGVEGGSLPIQMEHWYTMYNFNQVQTFAVTVLASYVGTLFSSACAMLISAKTRSTVLAITVPFILTCVSPFVGRIPVLTRASSLFPDMLFRLNTEMNGFLLYRIGGNIFSQFSVILVMYLILTCVLFPLLYVLYRNS